MATKEEVALRRQRALQLRASGFKVPAIARQLKCSTTTVKHDLNVALAAAGQDRADLGNGVATVNLEIEHLDGLTQALETVFRQAVAEGNHDAAMKASDRLLRISKRRSSLLGHERSDAKPGSAEASRLSGVKDELSARRGGFGSKQAARRRGLGS